jgi:hypothetical protein
VVVVSEETGSISVACEGHFFTGLNRETLAKLLGRLTGGTGLSALLERPVRPLSQEPQGAEAAAQPEKPQDSQPPSKEARQ